MITATMQKKPLLETMHPFVYLLSAFCLIMSAAGADKPALDISGWNRDTRPQDDFFEFANGGWLKNTEIPSDKTRWGSFVILAEESRDAVQTIIDELSAKDGLKNGSNPQKIRDLYRSFMNEERVNELGVAPIKAYLQVIEGISSKNEFGKIWAEAGRLGISNPIGAYINQDGKDSTRYALYFTQSGLGLPDRDYYFQDDERSTGLKEAYRTMLARLFDLAGLSDGLKKSATIFELEKRIAGAHWTRVENRDRIKTYNKKK